MHTVVIAEAGVNHDGDLSKAVALIDAAVDAGADVVKFQTFKASALATPAAQKAEYQVRQTGSADSQQEMLQRLELDAAAHSALLAHCAKREVAFLSTAFDDPSLDLLLGLDMPYLKVPSGEITNLPMLRRIGAAGRKVLLSTGMANLGEVEAAVEALEAAGAPRSQITILHCTTDYPASLDEVNLRAMVAMAAAFGTAVGYSDHTEGIEISTAAVAMGATVIEKHLTLDRSSPGPDHAASLEPAEFAAMISAIRNVERALGDGIKRPTLRERTNRVHARKSIVAARDLPAGHVLAAADLAVKRPGVGVSPMRWDELVGRAIARSYATDEALEG
jgi:N,N'-diacetyllegionaminate synthase